MFFSSSQKKGDVCLVLDIGNASLAGSLVLYKKGSVPEALYTTRVPLSAGGHSHSEKLQSILLTQIKEVLSRIHTKGFDHVYFKDHDKNVVKVLCAYASPWYVSKTKKVEVLNPKTFLITKNFIDDVLEKEVSVFEEELLGGEHGDEFKSGVVVMEKTVVNIEVNGYPLDNPFNQKTNQFNMVLYLGIGSESVTSMVNSEILKFFPINKEDILQHSFPLITYSVLKKIFPKERNYIFFDITGEVTDVALIDNGVIRETASFPSGKFFIIRKIMREFDVPAEVAKSFLHLYVKDSASEEIVEKIQKVLIDVECEWSIYLENTLSSFGKISTLPTKVYMTADTDTEHIFIDLLKVSKTDMTVLWRKKLDIIPISNDTLKEFYISTKNINFDECLALDSIFLGMFQ
ncbi:MAG: hypothetical protein ACYCZW_00965 [Minisyncoccota bacterium]